MSDYADKLKSLYTALVDSREGYEEALADSGPKGLTTLFQEMIAMRSEHIEMLKPLVRGVGAEPDNASSFMATVHRTVISIRSMLTELDESILPGLVDGEERIRAAYDDTLAADGIPADARDNLIIQRASVEDRIADMNRRYASAS